MTITLTGLETGRSRVFSIADARRAVESPFGGGTRINSALVRESLAEIADLISAAERENEKAAEKDEFQATIEALVTQRDALNSVINCLLIAQEAKTRLDKAVTNLKKEFEYNGD